LWFIAILEGVVVSDSSFRCSLIAEPATAIANKSERVSKRLVPAFMTFSPFSGLYSLRREPGCEAVTVAGIFFLGPTAEVRGFAQSSAVFDAVGR